MEKDRKQENESKICIAGSRDFKLICVLRDYGN